MALRKKIDSNETELSIAEEASLGVLPVTPNWVPGEPNTYDNFGGELTLLARNPINKSRQRKKGVITDLDAAGGFNTDFTQTNQQSLLQGVMFADTRRKTNVPVTAVSGTSYTVADGTLFPVGAVIFASGFSTAANNGRKVVTANGATIVSVAGLTAEGSPPATAKIEIVGYQGSVSVTANPGALPTLDGLPAIIVSLMFAGEWFFVGGDGAGNAFTNEVNNGFKRIYNSNGTSITIALSQTTMVTETAVTNLQLFFSTSIKNELGTLIKRRSYQLERQLGAPDDAQPSKIQSEYLIGAVANEYTLNIETANKITADISFVAIDAEQRTATQNIKTGNRLPLVESDAFNTSSDFAMLRLNIIDPINANPNPLFAYITEATVVINNNVTPNKAVGVLGAFDVTAGTFEVSGDITAYFSTIEAVQAVRHNANCEINFAVVKENAGFVCDLPLVALGNGRLDVAQDEPITLPLSMDAATAVKINPLTDYTALWAFFNYLPNLASPLE